MFSLHNSSFFIFVCRIDKCALSTKSDFFSRVNTWLPAGFTTSGPCKLTMELPGSLPVGDGTIVSVSMRRSFHLAVVQRFSASVSCYRRPCTSLHALHHHRVAALPVAHHRRTRSRWSRLVPTSSSSLATFKEGLQGAPPARIFARKMSVRCLSPSVHRTLN